MRVHFGTIVYLVGFVVYVAIRGVFGTRTKGNQQAVSRAGALDRALVGLVFIGHVVLPALYLLTSWLGFADYRLPTVLPWCGSVVMVVALWLFWRAHADLAELVDHVDAPQRA
jgi:hypothetical protein